MQPPEFLLLPKSEWPHPKLQVNAVTQPVFTTTDEERNTAIKVDSATNAMVKRENFYTSAKSEPILEVLRFFDWFCLLRATARVVQFKDFQQKRKRDLRIDDREMAKTFLYGQSQHATYTDTIKRLTTHKALDHKDALLPYSPFMDGNLIRARGRLRHSPMPDSTKYLIILYAKEPSIQNMIKNAHYKCMPLGTGFV